MPGHIVFLGRGEGHTPLRRVRLAVDLVYEFPGKMLRIMYSTTCEQAPAQHAPAAAEELVREFLEVGYVYEEVGRAVPGHFVLDAVGIDEHQPVHSGGVVQGEAEGDTAAQRQPDEAGFVQVQGIQEVIEETGIVIQGVLDGGFVALAVTRQVRGEDPVVRREGTDFGSPGDGGGVQASAVQEDYG